MCPYAKRNKNALELEESLLLSYALNSFQNFLQLKNAGLSSQAFSSLFLLNDLPKGKIVPTLPLFKLAYHYMECAVNQDSDFSSLPTAIANALDQNNKEKLLPQNIQIIREYLSRLQKNSINITKEKLSGALNRVLYPAQTESRSQKDISNESKTDRSECISGLLGTIPPTASPSVPPDDKPATNSAPCKMEYHSEKAVNKNITENTPEKPLPKKEAEESLYLPASFSPCEAERTGFPFYTVAENSADLHRLEVFLQFNPLLGAEVVEDAETKKQMLLLCASNQFYYIETDAGQALSLLRLYFSKSSIRRQICLEPYKLYYFLQANDIHHKNVYSLRTAYKVLAETRGSQNMKKPSEMIKELASKTNLYGYTPYIFSMLHYVKMYEALSAQELLKQKKAQEKLRSLAYIESLLGISYKLSDVAKTDKPLFELDEKGEYQFHYTPGLEMKEGIYSVTFSFSAEKPLGSLIANILYGIAKKNLAKIKGYRLLRFAQDSFTIATTSHHYRELCEIVSNLATYLAERQELIPLIIKEDVKK